MGKRSVRSSGGAASARTVSFSSQESYGGARPVNFTSSTLSPVPEGDDDIKLETLGYKQELKRNYSRLELFGMSFSIMSVAPSVASVLTELLPAGGVGLTWGWFVPLVFIMTIGITMGEMASSMPTAGGLYWWTYQYAPQRLKSWLSFLCGYADTLGLIAGGGSITYGAAQQILSCAELSNGYEPSNGVTFAVFIALILLQLGVGCMPTKVVINIQTSISVLNVVVLCLVCIAMPVGMHHHGIKLNSGDFVFGNTSNYTNYPYGMSFMLAWMGCIWSISSQDACIHMAEEASNAATAVPFGILASSGVCGLLGFLVLTILAACIDSSDAGMTALMGSSMPIASIIERALNKQWAMAIMALFAVIQSMMGMSSLLSTSRLVYAFARDDALPFSRWLKLTTKRQLPVPALIFTMTVAALLGLLILAGHTAAQAIFSMAMSSLYLSWCMPIFCYAFSAQRLITPGPFYLGHVVSKANALVASAFGMFVIFGLSMLPANVPVTTADTMNYSCVVCGAVWIGASLYWLIDARKWYHGPKSNYDEGAQVLEASNFSDPDSAETLEKRVSKEII